MSVKIESTRAIKPVYGGRSLPSSDSIPLSVFDKFTYKSHFAVICAYRAPTPLNEVVIQGLQRVLSEYREWAGRMVENERGDLEIVLSDEGVKLVEATVDSTIDEFLPATPSPVLLSLHPRLKDVEELLQVQLTRFKCGSLVIGLTAYHLVSDGCFASQFLVAWGRASRGLDVAPLPLHDRSIFNNPQKPSIVYDHVGAEFACKKITDQIHEFGYDVNDVVIEKVHLTLDFIRELKATASNQVDKPYSTFVSALAHLWRVITKARGLAESVKTTGRIAVNGRQRVNPPLPDEYFGNLVLSATPQATVKDLLHKPLSYAAKLIHDAIASADDGYFKSFIYFATNKAEEEGLVHIENLNQKYLWPDMEVNSWLGLPFNDFDFGGGKPYLFMPSYFPTEGLIHLLPSPTFDGSVDAFIPLFRENVASFRKVCPLLE